LPRLAFGRAKIGLPYLTGAAPILRGKSPKGGFMLDSLLKEELLEQEKASSDVIGWAINDWLKDIQVLSPDLIAELYFHHLQENPCIRDKWMSDDEYCDITKKKLDELSKKKAAFRSVIAKAASNELSSITVDFYKYKWPFEISGYVWVDGKGYCKVKYQLTPPYRTIEDQAGGPLDTVLIPRKAFREWLECNGLWPLEEECLLRKWFTDEKDEDHSFQFINTLVEEELPKTYRSDKQERIDALNRAWEKIQERAREHGIELNRKKMPGKKDRFYELVYALEPDIRPIRNDTFKTEYLKGEFKFSGTRNDPWSELFPEFMQSHDR
jgi:hypothetical protein